MLFLDGVYVNDPDENQRLVPITHHQVVDIEKLVHSKRKGEISKTNILW
jgi:hypothetical protein